MWTFWALFILSLAVSGIQCDDGKINSSNKRKSRFFSKRIKETTAFYKSHIEMKTRNFKSLYSTLYVVKYVIPNIIFSGYSRLSLPRQLVWQRMSVHDSDMNPHFKDIFLPIHITLCIIYNFLKGS